MAPLLRRQILCLISVAPPSGLIVLPGPPHLHLSPPSSTAQFAASLPKVLKSRPTGGSPASLTLWIKTRRVRFLPRTPSLGKGSARESLWKTSLNPLSSFSSPAHPPFSSTVWPPGLKAWWVSTDLAPLSRLRFFTPSEPREKSVSASPRLLGFFNLGTWPRAPKSSDLSPLPLCSPTQTRTTLPSTLIPSKSTERRFLSTLRWVGGLSWARWCPTPRSRPQSTLISRARIWKLLRFWTWPEWVPFPPLDSVFRPTALEAPKWDPTCRSSIWCCRARWLSGVYTGETRWCRWARMLCA